jgi:hypothetical protein
MNQPAIEIVITHIGRHTITDRSTDDGRLWAQAFHTGAEHIPGIARLTYGISQQDPEIALHLIGKSTRDDVWRL